MYIDRISVENFRSFERAEITFTHPNSDFVAMDMPRARISNVNLLVGDNGAGKSSLRKAILLACLGPAAGDSGNYPFRLIRRGAGKVDSRRRLDPARIAASFSVGEQEQPVQLLHRQRRHTRAASSKSLLGQQQVEFVERTETDPWRTEFHTRTDRGAEHPGGNCYCDS